ncbi:MAG: acyl-CoA dehydrogenase family protein [Myxococcota bacterium]|nr:acyl-CoA dehydrogenase family protein [Myxococcota bacterium]
MDLHFSAEDEAFRREAADWLESALAGEFSVLRGRGGSGDDSALIDERKAWEKRLAAGGWTCVGWPREYGGRGASLTQQVIFHEEYARAGAPGRLNHMGETLLGPTLIAFGTEAQKQRFLPPIVAGEEIWCQGYSEPGAGSDLAAVQTRAEREGSEWVIHGQKVWTSWAEWADWCFVVARTDPDSKRNRGLSYLLVPMDQPGITIRPIEQITGDAEFFEVFYDGARTEASHVVGEPDQGWSVIKGTLAFERGVSTLGQQMLFQRELQAVIDAAKENGRASDPLIRQRIADAWMGLEIQRYNALRTLSNESQLSPEGLITKIYWATWHRELGKLAMDVLGPEAEVACAADEGEYALTPLQRLFLFARSDTIYGGSNQIQRNLIAEGALGLPRDPRPQ